MKETTLRARIILLAPKGKEGAITEALTAGEIADFSNNYLAAVGSKQAPSDQSYVATMLRAMEKTTTASGLKCVFEFGEGITATFLLNGACYSPRAPWKLRRRRRWPLTLRHRPLAAAEAALPEMQAQVAATEEMVEAAKAAIFARASPTAAPALPAAAALEPVAEEAQPPAAALPFPPDSPDATASRGLGQPPTPLAPLASPSRDAPRGGDSDRRSSVDHVHRVSGLGNVARRKLSDAINAVNGMPLILSGISSKQECVYCLFRLHEELTLRSPQSQGRA